jgi:hypothetical protein
VLLAATAAASMTSLACFESDTYWFHISQSGLAPRPVAADEWVTYRIEAAVGFPADAGLESLRLTADLEAHTDGPAPQITVELGAGESDRLVYAHTERGLRSDVSTRMEYEALGAQPCELPKTGWGYCEFLFYLHVHTDVAAELRGRVVWSPQGRTTRESSGTASDLRVRFVEEDGADVLKPQSASGDLH